MLPGAVGVAAAHQLWTRRRLLIASGSAAAAALLGTGGITASISGATQPPGNPDVGGPSALALAEIPSELLPLFQAVGTTAVPWNMLAAVAWQESRFNPQAVSPAGAGGLMQIVAATATSLGITEAERFEPAKAVPAAARHLAQQKRRFGTDQLMLAAYNAGPGNVERHAGIPPFPETQRYVQAVTAKAAAYTTSNPDIGSATATELLALNGRLADGAPLEIYPRGLADLPHMDPRILGLIATITNRFPGVYVSSLKTGHSQYINGTCGSAGGCRQSRHGTYQACDLWKVGGQIVAANNPAPRACWIWLKNLTHNRPRAVGSPWGSAPDGGGATAGHFTDADHQDHFHLDFD